MSLPVYTVKSQISLSIGYTDQTGGIETQLLFFCLSQANIIMFQTVADLGSEVTVMKSQVDSMTQFVKTAETKLEEMSNKATNVTVMNKPIISIVFLNVWTS